MKERPIIFSALMVKAILEGRKTMTRRPLKEQPSTIYQFIHIKNDLGYTASRGWLWAGFAYLKDNSPVYYKCPYGQFRDILWVRESAWYPQFITRHMMKEGADTWPKIIYGDNDKEWCQKMGWKKKPSIHMPRWASRIMLEITNIRVERLQEITEEDAIREGCQFVDHGLETKVVFKNLWNSIHGKDAWNLNPWVWVILFKRI